MLDAARERDETRVERLPDAALFLDWENIKFSLHQRGMQPSLAAILDACERYGRVVTAYAYADWQQYALRDDATDLYVAGIEPVFVPVRRYREEDERTTVKNSVDVRIAVDCIETVHTHPQIDIFVLATGDQDFLHVVNRLRPYGKQVIGLSVSWTASPRLVERVDRMIFYDEEVAEAHPQRPPAPAPIEAQVQTRADRAAESIARSEELALEDVQAAVEAITRTLQDYRGADREINVSVLGTELQRALRADRFRTVVRGRLQRIVRELERQGALQIVTRGIDDWLYRPEDSIPEAESSSAASAPPPPVFRASRLDWPTLSDAAKSEAVRLVQQLRQTPGVDYLVFNRVAEMLEQSPILAEIGAGRDIANAMVAAGVLQQGEQRQWYDSFTGRTGSYWTLRLNPDHEDVRAGLSAPARE